MAKDKSEKKKDKKPSSGDDVAASPKAAAKTAAAPALSYDERKKFVSIIAKPLADEKLTKKVLKLAKRAAKRRQIKRGVKEVVKALRKGAKGVVVLAGDISPIDVLTHIPVVCEDAGVPYVYVPSKEELGAAALSKRPTSCMLLLPKAPPRKSGKDGKGEAKGEDDEAEAKEVAEAYAECEKKIKELA
jgi:H/ACA ribonucleoprotein complex subunit 2